MAIAPTRVGFGAVFFAPNSRFIMCCKRRVSGGWRDPRKAFVWKIGINVKLKLPGQVGWERNNLKRTGQYPGLPCKTILGFDVQSVGFLLP